MMPHRSQMGRTAYAAGLDAEETACEALVKDGWTIHRRRMRTRAGEVDVVAEKSGILAIIEVKSRRTLAQAAACLTVRQQSRLLAACELILADHPGWGRNGVRLDVIVIDAGGRVRRIADAFRGE